MPRLRQRQMADTPIVRRARIIKFGRPLFLDDSRRNPHCDAPLIAGENIVVRDDDDFSPSHTFAVSAEFPLEHADRAWSADVVRQQDIDVDPDIIAGNNEALPDARAKFFL